MKPNLGKFKDPELDNMSIKLTQILSHVNLDNITFRIINGVTDPTPNTSRVFRHGMDPRPWVGLTQGQTGGVYVYSIGNVDVDIRSTLPSSSFSMIMLG